MLLHYLGKLKIQIFCTYSSDMEENANKSGTQVTDEYLSVMISHKHSCGSAACPLDSGLIRCLNIFFSVWTARSATAWPPVNCACVLQLFQQLINTMLCPTFLRKFVCQPLCCVPLQVQNFYQNIVIVIEYHVDCWQALQWRLLWLISSDANWSQ